MSDILMPKATAVWLVDNTSLTFDQIADFCGLHPLEVRGIADGDVSRDIRGVDPITGGDQDQRVNDGLPQTLEEVVATYRHAWWKLKVGGDVAADVDRLCRIAAVLDRLHGYHVTLDGNEQYEDAEGALALWRAIRAEPRLRRLAAAVAFIEQPVKRAGALSAGMGALAAERPVIEVRGKCAECQ